MKRRLIPALAFVAVLFFVFSVTIDLAVAADKASFLGDRHKEKGMNCGSCHKESPPKAAPGTDTCQGCHKDYAKPTAKQQKEGHNPHVNHLGITDCGVCHHAHKPSEDQCKACHSFDFTVP